MSEHPGKTVLGAAVDGVRGIRPHPLRIDRGMVTAAVYGLREYEIEAIASYVSTLEARLEKAEAERDAAYLAGFRASGEGYNGEYPFTDAGFEEDENWCAMRHRDLEAIKDKS